MSLYIYAPTFQTGTRELIATLGAKRLIKHDGMRFLNKGTPVQFGPQDAIVCWGGHVPAPPGVACLNASYEFPTMEAVATTGVSKLYNIGQTVMVPMNIAPKRYTDGLANIKAGDWYPSSGRDIRYAAIPELVNYATEYYRFEAVRKVFVFKGKEVYTDLKEQSALPVNIVEALKLDFAMVYMGGSRGSAYYALRILTAPSLSEKEVNVVAEHIRTWYKGVVGVE
jgi:hypothetical protein